MGRMTGQAATAFLFLAACASPAGADELSVLMGAGGNACFARTYTGDHLADHPEQNVRVMTMGLRRKAGSAPVELSLDITFRGGGTTRARAMADCSPGTGAYLLGCAAVCGGGRIMLLPRGSDAVRLEIPRAIQLERGGTCDPDSLRGNGALWADDTVFRLERADLSVCGLEIAPSVELPGNAPPVADPAEHVR